jgi:hypothetical protein
MAPNPPSGAVIDYYLKDASTNPVTLDILDAHGKLVRHYSSADKQTPPDPSTIDATPDWFPQPTALLASDGMHRFVWDLRSMLPEELDVPQYQAPAPTGVWVLPGSYTVKLTVDGKTYSQSLTVLNDPRVKASTSDLARQQELAFQIEAMRRKLAQAVDEVTGVLKQLEADEAKAPTDLATRLKAFEDALSAETELHAVPPGYGQPGAAPARVGSLAYVAKAFDALQPSVQNADGPPSPDAVQGYAKQKPKADKAIAAWEKRKTQDLPGLNEALKAAGLEALGGK